MYAKKNVQHAQEFLKWLVLLAIAGATSVLIIQVASGGEQKTPPRLLPDQIGIVAQPLINDFDPPYFQSQSTSPPSRTLLASVHLWEGLKLHENLDLAKAKSYWLEAQLAESGELWRYIALADISMRQLELEDMVWSLEQAERLDDNHAVVHFYYGQLHLLQAKAAENWPNHLSKPSKFRLVSTYQPMYEMPLTKNMYLLMATQRLELAIMEADEILLDAPVVDWEDDLQKIMAPNVEDCLSAMNNLNFVGKAHLQLSEIWLERLNLPRAEAHVDLAKEKNMAVSDHYLQIAQKYELETSSGDAVRNYTKAIISGAKVKTPMQKILDNLRTSLRTLSY